MAWTRVKIVPFVSTAEYFYNVREAPGGDVAGGDTDVYACLQPVSSVSDRSLDVVFRGNVHRRNDGRFREVRRRAGLRISSNLARNAGTFAAEFTAGAWRSREVWECLDTDGERCRTPA